MDKPRLMDRLREAIRVCRKNLGHPSNLNKHRRAGSSLGRTHIVGVPKYFLAGTSAREREDQITLFKSVGTGLRDVVAGFAIFEGARRLGLGQQIDGFLEHKRF